LSTDEAATAVALWQRRLMPLADAIEEVTPQAYVWARIRDALQLDQPVRSEARPRTGLWNHLPLWHWLGLGAGALAAALLVVVSLPYVVPTPTAVNASYMAAAIQQDNGSTGWTATLDLQHARMIIVPATPIAFEAGREPELWLIPSGSKPISVGMIARDKATTLSLSPALLAQLSTTAALAVSVEPIGGSPTGQPTGAVIGKGVIGTAPDATRKVSLRVDNHANDGSV
ncbi:MAG: anti-sigma factor, partial [Rhodanobacter sp.]